MGRLQRDLGISHMPGTVTFNYYQPCGGLRPHTDDTEMIAELVIGISLGSCCVMDFVAAADTRADLRHHAVLLEPGTVMIQTGEARYHWTHGIDPSPVHKLPDVGILKRGPRVAVQLSDID